MDFKWKLSSLSPLNVQMRSSFRSLVEHSLILSGNLGHIVPSMSIEICIHQLCSILATVLKSCVYRSVIKIISVILFHFSTVQPVSQFKSPDNLSVYLWSHFDFIHFYPYFFSLRHHYVSPGLESYITS